MIDLIKLDIDNLTKNATWDDWTEIFDTGVVQARWYIRYFKPWGKRFLTKRAMCGYKYPNKLEFSLHDHDKQKSLMLEELYRHISRDLSKNQSILYRSTEVIPTVTGFGGFGT